MRSEFIVRLLGAALLFAPVAFSGTILTANLPQGSAIININGAGDGAATFNPNQSLWFQPFNSDGNGLLEFTFQPGTYNFRLTNQTDAATLFPSLTSSQLALIGGGAWTYNTPWATDYLAFPVSAASNSAQAQLFAGAVIPPGDVPRATGFIGGGYDNAQDAYRAAILGNYYNLLISGTAGRYGGTVSNSFTFAAAQTLIFAVPDFILSDNGGVVSVLVTPGTASVPEPGSALLVAAAMLSLAVAYRRRARAN